MKLSAPLAETFTRSVDQADLDQLIQLCLWFWIAVGQWLDPEWLHSSVSVLTPPISVYVHTDASDMGWAAHTDLRTMSGLWTAAESAFHINLLKMEAVARPLSRLWHRHPTTKGLLVLRQNALLSVPPLSGRCSLSFSGKEGSRHPVVVSNETNLPHDSVTPGKLNVMADHLSRSSQELQSKGTISHQGLRPLLDLWVKPHIVRFATRYNHCLSVFVSPVRDPVTWGQGRSSDLLEGSGCVRIPVPSP